MEKDQLSPSVDAPVKVLDFLKMFRRDNRKETIIFLYSAFALTFWYYLPHFSLGEKESLPFLQGEYQTLGAFLLMGLIPAGIVKWVFRENLADYGVRLGNFFTFRSMLIFVPVMILFGYLGAFNDGFLATVYPYNPAAAESSRKFALHAAFLFFFYYTGWEFMFRGFIQHGLGEKCTLFQSIWIATLASTMLHFGHPMTETLSAVGGGIFWGFLAPRTRSILSGMVQHACLGIVMNYFLLQPLWK